MAEFPIPSFLLNQSVEEIHERMMKHLPSDIDKSEGGHPWNLTMPSAYLGSYFAEYIVPEAIKIFFPKYAQDYADVMNDHAEMRGIVRKAATYATGEITITGDSGTEIPAGSSFSTASVNGEPAVEFVTTEATIIGSDGTATVEIRAVIAGTIGNVPAETIILKANNISGITGVTNTEETDGGTEQESIESLQARIMDYDESQGVSYVGSDSDYKRWAMEVDGVGSAIIISAQDSSGLVTIIITDANGDPANENLREAVYNHIMRPDAPEERLAPINGGNILVVAPETIAISVSVTIEADGSVATGTIKENILNALKEYMVEATEEGKVRYTRIGSVISATAGVEDYNSLFLNGSIANIPISNQQLPTIDEENLYITFENDIEPDTGGSVTPEDIEEALMDYLEENPLETQLLLDETLQVNEEGELGVNTTEDIEAGNNLPVTANAVNQQVEAIDDVLEDI